MRDHNVPIYVDPPSTWPVSTSAKAWPPAKDIDPLAVVVSKCLFEKDQEFLGDKITDGPFWWGARVGIKGHEGGDDTLNVVHIPKAKTNEMVTYFARNPEMARSALVTTFQPYLENAKPINIAASNLKADKDCNIKSLAVNPPRKKKDGTAADVDEESTLKRKADDGEEDAPPKKKMVASKKSTQTTLVPAVKPKDPAAEPKRSSLFPPKSVTEHRKSTRDEAGCSAIPSSSLRAQVQDKVTASRRSLHPLRPALVPAAACLAPAPAPEPVAKKAGVAKCVPTYHFTIKKGETSATFSFDLAHPATEDIDFTATPN